MTATPVIDRHALVLQRVTLNGAPAQVMGIRNDFATVRALRGECAPVEYAWATVDKIVRSTGEFKS